MCIAVGKQEIEEHQTIELDEFHSPGRNMFPDERRYVLIAFGIVLVVLSGIVRCNTGQRRKIFLLNLASVWIHIIAFGNIGRRTVLEETEAVGSGRYLVHLLCNLHGQVFIGRAGFWI